MGASPPRTQTLYLSGAGKDDAKQWDFFCTGGRHSGQWTQIAVPSCWELQGFGRYQYGLEARSSKEHPHPDVANEHGLYRTHFTPPAAWASGHVHLVFDGVMTDAVVRVNGQPAGPMHQGAFYRFSYDITPLVHFGDPNLLEVDVAKSSSNRSVDAAERQGDYWNFGGIFRPVYLEAVPTRSIGRVAIDARADGSFHADVFLDQPPGDAPDEAVEVQLLSASGHKVGPPVRVPLALGATHASVDTQLADPARWTAETPNLYRARFTLYAAGHAQHETTATFGFRTFEVRPDDGLYLNGAPIKLKGVCRHSFWPESGRTLSRSICYDDVRLMKAANLNAVRMSHYPPDAAFLQACDELGLYVLDELGGWHGAYDTPTGRKLIGEMVRRDVNHPSILFWDNGNEGGFNFANDGQYAKWDPQRRPVLHPWADFSHVATNHYRPYDETVAFCRGPEIFMPTEFLHGLYDGGAGSGLEDYWQAMNASPTCAGGFIWAWLDEAVVRTDENGRLDSKDNWAPDGIVGPHREPEGSYYAVRQIWCPVQIGPPDLPARTSAAFPPKLTVQNRFDFLNLKRCVFRWELATFPPADAGASGHRTLASGTLPSPDIAPHAAGALALPADAPWDQADVLYVSAADPSGRLLYTWSWSMPRSAPDTAALEIAAPLVPVEGPTLTAGPLTLRFDAATGELAELKRNGDAVALTNGPRLVAFRRVAKHFEDISAPLLLKTMIEGRDGADLVVTATYAGPLQRVTWRISPAGVIRIGYEASFPAPVDILGVTFDFPESAVRAKRWLGGGPYHVWRNRTAGATLDVWQNPYNDTVPGDTWIYPEFKGFFPDWRWMSLDTNQGTITFTLEDESPVLSPLEGSYFGVYRPNDGRVGPVLPLPPLGLGVYRVIPAMGSKTATPDLLGPHGRTPDHVEPYRGAFRLNFN